MNKQERIQHALNMRKKGMLVKVIAQDLGVTTRVVWRYLRESGFIFKRSNKAQKIRQLKDKSIAEIAQELKCSTRTVYRYRSLS